MATRSSVLAWRIPAAGEPGGGTVYGVAQSRSRLKRLSSSSGRVLVAVCGLSLAVASMGYTLLQCASFSLWWLLL